jgi:hypothetical protein
MLLREIPWALPRVVSFLEAADVLRLCAGSCRELLNSLNECEVWEKACRDLFSSTSADGVADWKALLLSHQAVKVHGGAYIASYKIDTSYEDQVPYQVDR